VANTLLEHYQRNLLRSSFYHDKSSTISKQPHEQYPVWPTPIEPQTPVTLVLAEAFMSLQDLIIQRDAYALDETSKQNLAKHLQKCTKAFQKSFAYGILQEDRI